MRRFRNLFMVAALSFLLLSCASMTTTREFVLEEPQPGMSAVVGAIIVENDGVDGYYQSVTRNIGVYIAGKSTQDGEEQTEAYKVYTDENGYFMLQNVPPGSYELKGIEFILGVGQEIRVSLDWEGGRKYYHIIEGEMNYMIRNWPDEVNETIINKGINYFLVDRIVRLRGMNTFDSLDGQTLNLPDETYNMPAPPEYFSEKYPDSGWF